MKKIISFITTVAILFLLIPNNVVNAAENTAENDFGELIKVDTFEEDGCTVVQKTYFKPSNESGISSRGKSGEGSYTNEKTYIWDKDTPNESTMTYYAQGYFIWGDGDVNVKDKTGGISGQPKNITLSNKKLEGGKGKYGAVLNNYAYVTLSFSAMAPAGIKPSNFSVTIRVSESGNVI